jgi:LEM3 (ligand-effect modulator 3) family / CDC50 family
VIIGFLIQYASDTVIEQVIQYDGAGTPSDVISACGLPSSGPPYTRTCTLTFNIANTMKSPVYLYYELTNFYQNQRRYVASISLPQCAGTIYTNPSDVPSCNPLATLTSTINGTLATRVIHPCGLISMSFFNDTFYPIGGPAPGTQWSSSWTESGIAWPSDLTYKFKNIPYNVQAQYANQVVFINQIFPNVSNVDDEHFVVWMRVAALPKFRKLYARILNDIPAGSTYTIQVQSNYRVSSYSGTKALVLSTASPLGGKNPFLGIAYYSVGFICIFFAAFFATRTYFGGRKLGDTSYLVWNRR